jgi:large subunit ribosomal protein L24
VKTGKKQPKLHIKRGDIVMAISGGEAGAKKTGKVLQVFPEQGRVIVEGLNYVKKHLRKSQDNPKGGIIDKEAPIHVSNLKLHKESEHKDAAAKPAKK